MLELLVAGFARYVLLPLALLLMFFPALKWRARPRSLWLMTLALAMLLPPLLGGPTFAISRFMVALWAALMAMKMWDLHLSVAQGARPTGREFVNYAVNPFLLVWRNRGKEPQPRRRRVVADLLVAVVIAVSAVLVLGPIVRYVERPYLLVHTVAALGLMTFVIAELNLYVALTRLCGGYLSAANQEPWQAVTPADFWRRYNRIIGQFLVENAFKFVGGLRHPVRGVLVAFFVSGLLHEYVFWAAIGRAPGLQMLFFMLQGLAVVVTARVKPPRHTRLFWRMGTWVFMIITSIPFFASFHWMVAIYPDGVPAWIESWAAYTLKS